jgi:hypothetical protein
MNKKLCSHCHRELPQTRKYFGHKRDGWESWCRVCKRDAERDARTAMRAADDKRRAGLPLTAHDERLLKRLDNNRASNRRYQERRRQDPVLKDADRDRNRVHMAARRADPVLGQVMREAARFRFRDSQGGDRTFAPSRGNRHYRTTLTEDEHFDPEPFRMWLEETFAGWSDKDVGIYLGISDRSIHGVRLGEYAQVTLTVVDRAFAAVGRPDLLEQMYPLNGGVHAGH